MKTKMKVLDLFSGIGGFSLGLERAGMETIAFCEIEEYPRKVLKKHWPDIQIHEDVRKLDGHQYRGTVDVICGGYPCQPFSTAGKRRGKEDDRHLWPEVNRLIQEVRPAWFIGENVAGHVSMGLDEVLSDLEGQGYSWEAFIIPAVAVDAPHRRDRVWIVANNNSNIIREEQEFRAGSSGATKLANDGLKELMANSAKIGRRSVQQEPRLLSEESEDSTVSICRNGEYGGKDRKWNAWKAEPRVGRVADGVPSRVDRLRALGNAVVPQIPEIIGRAILEINNA